MHPFRGKSSWEQYMAAICVNWRQKNAAMIGHLYAVYTVPIDWPVLEQNLTVIKVHMVFRF